jgi:hypothetical protein
MAPAIIDTNEELKSHQGERLLDDSGARGTVVLKLGDDYRVHFEGGAGTITENQRARYRNNWLQKYGEPVRINVCPKCGNCMDEHRRGSSVTPEMFTRHATDMEMERGYVFNNDLAPCLDCAINELAV